jgi:ribosomal protein S18 acetylase RimI-like enzyme
MTAVVRHPTGLDHARVDSVIDVWWGDRPMRRMLPRLFFEHFADTSFVLEQDGELAAFLVGFISTAHPDEAYIHFVGVRPDLRREGHARALYERFFALAGERGCRHVGCITAAINESSIAFHRSMGFDVVPGDADVDGTSVHTRYDGRGEDRVVFRRALP